MSRIRVGIIGASGITGGELIRLLLAHPDAEITFLGGSSSIGATVPQLHPGLREARLPPIEKINDTEIGSRCDVVFLATPAAVSAHLASELAGTVRVIDLSGAFRIQDPDVHARWYPAVRRDEALARQFVYGVPELIADEIVSADLISVPGCFATAVTLALAPIVGDPALPLDRVLVDGKTGSSGGGISYDKAGAHPYRNGAITPYAPGGHRHAAEVKGFFSTRAETSTIRISMSAYGVSNVRGLLASCYLFPASPLDGGNLFARYTKFYKSSPFVRIRRLDETSIPVPDPHVLVGSNYCDISVVRDTEGERIVVLAALDNIVKGAAGQAVQMLNISLGLEPGLGLQHNPVVPV